jgi:hypothetical protein
MLSEELRNLALWISTRRRYRAMLGVPCDPSGEVIVSNVLEELAEQAERMESGTRLMSGAEIAEMVSREGIGR